MSRGHYPIILVIFNIQPPDIVFIVAEYNELQLDFN